MPENPPTHQVQRVALRFGADASRWVVGESPSELTVHVAVPVIGGSSALETICRANQPSPLEESGDPRIAVTTLDTCRVAVAVAPIAEGLEKVTHAIYARLFKIFDGNHGYRSWNYVPNINREVDGQEDYWRFNAGRHCAYIEHFGEHCEALMPAASAVGCAGDSLVVVAIGGTLPVTHFENPRQVPAYRYPRQYGEKPPSFARGTIVWTDHTMTTPSAMILSGTSSIIGHETVGQNSIDEQIAVTMENLRIVTDSMLASAGLDNDFTFPDTAEFKLYLRHQSDADRAIHALTTGFGIDRSKIIALETSICRPDLDIEIEGRW